MQRMWMRWLVVAVVGLTIAAMSIGGAGAQSTTTSGSTTSGASGATTNGNAKAAKAVKNNTLTGTAGSGLTRGVSSSSVKVGCYLQQQSFAGADDGFKARFERANTDKELPGGRTIDFSACQDDGNNPQNNLQIVTKLTQQDEVFAIVGISADFLQPSADFLARNQVPFFGWGFVPGFCANRWAFGFDGCLVTEYPGAKQKVYQSNLALGPIAAAGLTPKTTKVALQAGDDDAGKSGNVTIGSLYKLEGADVVYNESNLPVPGPPADFSPFVTAVKDKDPNLLLTLTNFQTAPGFTAAMSASGYTGANVNFVGYVPGLLSSSAQLAAALDGAYVSSQIVPQEQQTPYIKQVEKDLTAINAKTGKFITLAEAIAYVQADVLVSELKAVGKNLNTKTFDQKINGGGYTYKSSAAGGPGQMEFPAMHFIAADCAAMLKINGTAYDVSVPFTCYDSPVKK
jgi:branched-chain amino acid transport system substrate-binding protein